MNDKNHSCHSGHGQHKGHGWMMLLCVLLMAGIPLLILSSTMSSFSPSLLGTALLPLILCLIMHGVMMKFMMSGSKKEQDSTQEHKGSKEVKMIEHKTNGDSSFSA